MKFFLLLLFTFLFSCNHNLKLTKNRKGIKVLYLTGGSYHNYKLQEEYVRNGLIESLENVCVETFWLSKDKHYYRNDTPINKLVEPPNDISDYDVTIFNMCFAKTTDENFVEKVLATAIKKPTLFIHCAFHSFWDIDKRKEWG